MTINIGIIGTGSIAEGVHAPAITSLPNANLVAVLSRDKKRGEEFLDRHSAIQTSVAHTSLDDFVADKNIELVIICTPDGLHYAQAVSCLNHNKHVLLEKPMATELDEAKKINQLANANGLTLAMSFHLRSHNGHRALYESVVNDQAIGDIRHIRVIWAFPQKDDSNWRAKEELAKWWSLSAVGAHCLDLARWFSSDADDWESFSSVISNEVWKGPHDETAVIAAELSSGATVEIVSSVQFGPYTRIEIFGSNGIAVCDNTLGREGGGKIFIDDIPLKFKKESPFIEQLNNVINNIESGTELTAGAETGVRSVKDLLLAIE